MTKQDMSAEKRLRGKIRDRLAIISAHSKAQKDARTVQVNLARLPLPCLFQG
jgi:hypothetical protein